MKFVSDPSISIKINKMKDRVQWGSTPIVERNIDQTSLVIEDGGENNPEFSFIVIGDSGSGPHKDHDPQRQIAQLMLQYLDTCRFILHTGDVVYQVGSKEFYHENFINPYQELLIGGNHPESIAYDQMVFIKPFLPVLGNHDYYDLSFLSGLLAQATKPIRKLLNYHQVRNIGRYGSEQGDIFTRAFIDYLKSFKQPQQLSNHLDTHYQSQINSRRCLSYQPKEFTRLPNRYYSFRYGGMDFFALDSNTFNMPAPLPQTLEGKAIRQLLEKRQEEVEEEELELIDRASRLHLNIPEEAEQLDDLEAKLEQLEEIRLDIDKQLTASKDSTVDFEQLQWLSERLIESWHNPEIRGRIIYFHHPPYVTEISKWNQAQTLAVRHHFRWILDKTAEKLGTLVQNRPLVDLIINGHAHCLEYLRTENTGHADSYLNWLVCGGSGFSLRRQRTEGAELLENFSDLISRQNSNSKVVARSHLFLGRTGYRSLKKRPYSCLKIDVIEGSPPKFVIHPLVAERYQRHWHIPHIEPILI